MYNYDLKKENEKIITEITRATIEVNNKIMLVSILVTNKNLLIFKNINEKNILNSRGMSMPEEYELIFKELIEEIDYSIVDNNTVINYKENVLVIKDFNLKEVK